MEKVLLSELSHFAKRVAQQISSLARARGDKAVVVALRGELGAGKTTFAQALGRELGVVDTMQSPTYVLMKSYPIAFKHFTTLLHIDAYRLNAADEFKALKPEEFLGDPHTLVLVEWPERVLGTLPKPDLTIHFSSDPPQGEAGSAGETERYVEIE